MILVYWTTEKDALEQRENVKAGGHIYLLNIDILTWQFRVSQTAFNHLAVYQIKTSCNAMPIKLQLSETDNVIRSFD